MNDKVMFKIGYGLYLLFSGNDSVVNGCVVNSVMQITTLPNRIVLGLNKANYSCDLIQESRKFNISILSTEATFDTIKNYGFRSGRDAEKCNDQPLMFADNALPYLSSDESVGYISCAVYSVTDMGTHMLIVADVTDGDMWGQGTPATYAYYHSNIKPKPTATPAQKTGYRCKICGYVYEGEPLPADFICPICKHGAVDFEKI